MKFDEISIRERLIEITSPKGERFVSCPSNFVACQTPEVQRAHALRVLSSDFWHPVVIYVVTSDPWIFDFGAIKSEVARQCLNLMNRYGSFRCPDWPVSKEFEDFRRPTLDDSSETIFGARMTLLLNWRRWNDMKFGWPERLQDFEKYEPDLPMTRGIKPFQKFAGTVGLTNLSIA